MSVANVFNSNDLAEGVPTFAGGLYVPKAAEPNQEQAQQMQQGDGSQQQQVVNAVEVGVVQQGAKTPVPDDFGGDFNPNSYEPLI